MLDFISRIFKLEKRIQMQTQNGRLRKSEQQCSVHSHNREAKKIKKGEGTSYKPFKFGLYFLAYCKKKAQLIVIVRWSQDLL